MNAKVYVLTIVFSLMMSTLFSQAEAIKSEIRANIDWLNGQTGAPTRASTYLHPVPIGYGYRSIRGPLSARSCLNYATIFALAGEKQSAIEWLQAGQDHAPSIQQLFAGNSEYCIEYIKIKYWEQAAKSFGAGAYAEWINSALGEIKKHNPSPANAPKEKVPRPSEPIERGSKN